MPVSLGNAGSLLITDKFLRIAARRGRRAWNLCGAPGYRDLVAAKPGTADQEQAGSLWGSSAPAVST
jgi:hypothetical protein